MSNHPLNFIASTLIVALTGAICGCHSDKAPRQLAGPTASVQATNQPNSLMGTVPLYSADEKVITPRETVGAATE